MENRDSRHLLITYAWGTADLGGIGIVPGLLNLIKKAALNLPTVVLTCQGKSPASKFLKGYLPRFLPGCRVQVNPFRSLFRSVEDGGTPGTAWHAFHQRWGPTKLREFENGSLSARIAKQIFCSDCPDGAEKHGPQES